MLIPLACLLPCWCLRFGSVMLSPLQFWAAGGGVTPQQMLTQDHIVFSEQLSRM